jgi:hypothetical protein
MGHRQVCCKQRFGECLHAGSCPLGTQLYKKSKPNSSLWRETVKTTCTKKPSHANVTVELNPKSISSWIQAHRGLRVMTEELLTQLTASWKTISCCSLEPLNFGGGLLWNILRNVCIMLWSITLNQSCVNKKKYPVFLPMASEKEKSFQRAPRSLSATCVHAFWLRIPPKGSQGVPRIPAWWENQHCGCCLVEIWKKPQALHNNWDSHFHFPAKPVFTAGK